MNEVMLDRWLLQNLDNAVPVWDENVPVKEPSTDRLQQRIDALTYEYDYRKRP